MAIRSKLPICPVVRFFFFFGGGGYLLFCIPIVSYYNFKKIIRVIMILKVAKLLANVVPNYPFAPEGNFFQKVDQHHFCLFIELPILQHFKQILIQGSTILAQIGPILPIFFKIYFLRKLTITFVCLLCSIVQQNFKKQSQRGNHQTRLHNFGPNWAWTCLPKRNLL